MKEVTVSRLMPNDWQTYKRVQLEALKEEPHAFGARYEEWVTYSDEKWQERPNNPNTLLFIARDGSLLAGMVGLYIQEVEGEKVAHVWGMYVGRNFRGKGVGKNLMHHALEAVEPLPEVKKVELMVNKDQTPAVLLYQSLGFQKVGETDWLLGDGKNHRLFVMEKKL